jgi:hypothetical protein
MRISQIGVNFVEFTWNAGLSTYLFSAHSASNPTFPGGAEHTNISLTPRALIR